MDASPGMAVGGGVDGLLGVGAGGGQVTESPQCVGMLGLDQSRLHVTGLGRFPVRSDAGDGSFRAGHRGMAAAPVTYPRVCLGLQGVQVGDEGCRQAAVRAAQGGLGVLDDLPVAAEVERLVREQGDHVPAEPAVSGGLGHPECLEVVALRGALKVGVVGADPGQRRQAASGPEQLPPGGVVVGALDERSYLECKELRDPGPYRDAPGDPVHALVPGACRPQCPRLLAAHPGTRAARYIQVVWRVLPLVHRRDGGGSLSWRGQVKCGGPLVVAAPQRCGGVGCLRQRSALILWAVAAKSSIGQRDGAAQPRGKDLADQVGHPSAGNSGVAYPPADRRVVVQQHQAVPFPGLVDARGEPVM